MRMLKPIIFRLVIALILVGSIFPIFEPGKAVADGAAIIIDHTSTNITQIPQSAIEAAKTSLHIGYGHVSHGAQLTNGMGYKQSDVWTGLVAFANGGGKGLNLPEDIFAWNNGGTDGALDMEEGYATTWDFDGGWLAGDLRFPQWVGETVEYLEASEHADVNVIMWAWCLYSGGAAEKYVSGTLDDAYLLPMRDLEEDYPDVTFVYMTSPLYHAGDANHKAANQMIREYFNSDPHSNKALYDFGDIESYDPDDQYFEFTSDDCSYYTSATDTNSDPPNWAEEWRAEHTENVDWYSCDAPHTDALNGNLKAYAAWWLWARLAGWDGTSTSSDTQAPSLTVSSPNGGEKRKVGCQYDIIWTATDDVGVTSANISYSTDNGASYTDIATGLANSGTYTWTVPDSASAECLIKVAAGDAAGNWGHDESDAVFEIYGPIPGDANNDCVVDALDITKTERIILGIDPHTGDADANGDDYINALDITEIEQISGS